MTSSKGAKRHDHAGGRYAYPSSVGELVLHATLLAIVLWVSVVADVATPGTLGRRSGLPKGNDFLVFYVSGKLADAGQFKALVHETEFHRAQESFLGPASRSWYPAIYPPQVGLAMAPLSRLPYTSAYFVWSILSLALFAAAVAELVRHVPAARLHPWATALLALAFPPLPYLILAGQVSTVALLSMAALHRGLARSRWLLAGTAVGLIGFKLSLFVPAVAICLLAGEWAIGATAIAVAVLQTLIVAPVAGLDVVLSGAQNLIAAAHNPDALATRPYLMVSWRSFWALLLPTRWVLVLYPIVAGLTVAVTAVACSRSKSALRRVALLSLAVVLAAPHLFIYDLVLTAPAFVYACRHLTNRQDDRLRRATVAAFLCPFAIPIAAWTHLQLITLILGLWWLLLIRLEDSTDGSINDAPQ